MQEQCLEKQKLDVSLSMRQAEKLKVAEKLYWKEDFFFKN